LQFYAWRVRTIDHAIASPHGIDLRIGRDRPGMGSGVE
jgi:hypothetical protein